MAQTPAKRDNTKRMAQSLEAMTKSLETQGLLIAETARRVQRVEETQETHAKELGEVKVSVARIETKVDSALGNGLGAKVREIAQDLRDWKNRDETTKNLQWGAILRIALAIFSLGVVSTAVIAVVQWLVK